VTPPTAPDKQHCLALARAVLDRAFDPSVTLPPATAFSLQKLPCFVTLKSPNLRLRGCIGRVATEDSLYQNICELTVSAAFEDPRFDAVTREEARSLNLEISILGPLKPVTNWDNIVIGAHGLKVTGRGRQGLLLAQVATEQGWDVEEFKAETCVKAGLDPEKSDHYQFQFFDQVEFHEPR